MTPEGWTILVGIDGSQGADEALAFAQDVCRALGGRLVLGAVYAYRPLGGRLGSGEAARDLVATRRVAGGCATRICPARTPAEGLLAIAEADQAHLIVVGSRHRGGLGEALPGATARVLLRDGRFLIVLVPEGHRRCELRRIGVVGDASLAGRAALLAAGIIASDSGAALHVQGVPRPRGAAAQEWRADDLAHGALDLLVVAARPHGLLGPLRRLWPTASDASRLRCPTLVVPARARLPVVDGPPNGSPSHLMAA